MLRFEDRTLEELVRDAPSNQHGELAEEEALPGSTLPIRCESWLCEALPLRVLARLPQQTQQLSDRNQAILPSRRRNLVMRIAPRCFALRLLARAKNSAGGAHGRC